MSGIRRNRLDVTTPLVRDCVALPFDRYTVEEADLDVGSSPPGAVVEGAGTEKPLPSKLVLLEFYLNQAHQDPKWVEYVRQHLQTQGVRGCGQGTKLARAAKTFTKIMKKPAPCILCLKLVRLPSGPRANNPPPRRIVLCPPNPYRAKELPGDP
ncbi:hypothetical protein ACH5RR_032497 [Cinchona calisaya]|uniref:Uncharacterized protein n=1 Tax=Cinchona calisaya TaxID=153742 RepID=A0ABD2YMG3_9GENT